MSQAKWIVCAKAVEAAVALLGNNISFSWLRSTVNISDDDLTAGSGCIVQWTTEPDTAVASGKRRSADTIAACQHECLINASCNGFDWNFCNSLGDQCWLSGPWSGTKHPFTNVTHYNLTSRCDGKYRMWHLYQTVVLLLPINQLVSWSWCLCRGLRSHRTKLIVKLVFFKCPLFRKFYELDALVKITCRNLHCYC